MYQIDEENLPATVTITMDPRMYQRLEVQADIEGYPSLEAYLHHVILMTAIQIRIEDIGDINSPSDAMRYIDELKEWMGGTK